MVIATTSRSDTADTANATMAEDPPRTRIIGQRPTDAVIKTVVAMNISRLWASGLRRHTVDAFRRGVEREETRWRRGFQEGLCAHLNEIGILERRRHTPEDVGEGLPFALARCRRSVGDTKLRYLKRPRARCPGRYMRFGPRR